MIQDIRSALFHLTFNAMFTISRCVNPGCIGLNQWVSSGSYCTRAIVGFGVYGNAAVVIWDIHVFINQLIKCEISFKRSFYLDWKFRILFCYLAA